MGKNRSSTEIYTFYINEQHWLYMDRDKMLAILETIRKGCDPKKWKEAFEIIRDSSREEVAELRANYYRKYRGITERTHSQPC